MVNLFKLVDKNSYKIVLGKPNGNAALGRPKYRWEDNIEIDLK
jgi:hypothetical protein